MLVSFLLWGWDGACVRGGSLVIKYCRRDASWWIDKYGTNRKGICQEGKGFITFSNRTLDFPYVVNSKASTSTIILIAFPQPFVSKLHESPKKKTLGAALPPSLQAATLRNRHLLTRRPTRGPDALDRLDEFLALNHFAKDGVLAVEMGSGDRGDEELGSIAA